MNYEKKYKEALEKARQFSENPLEEDSSSIVEYIFPELKESEDERIRKALIEYFGEQCDMSDWNGVYGYQVLAWLEKQGEKKSSDEVLKIRQEVYQSGYNDGYKHGIEDGKQGEKNTNNQPDVELSKDKVTIKKGENAQDLIEKYVSDHAANRWLDASELEKLLNDFVLEYDKIKNREYEQQCKVSNDGNNR